jgi:Ca-activated chloride channel family protein
MVMAALVACGTSDSEKDTNTLRIIGGSELKDMDSILADAKKATGVSVEFTYAGSLDGADQISSGASYDAAWFSSDKYISLAGAGNLILDRQKVMLSPVVVGVKQSVAQTLGWSTNGDVSWKEIANAAEEGKFRFAMTNPAASNSGFSALVGVATAFADNQALTSDTIDKNGLQQFFKGQALTSGSSGFLQNSYISSEGSLDGIINYESILLSMNDSGKLAEPLTLIYPTEGVVTADYPVMLLNSSKRLAYDKLTSYLTQKDVQAKIQTQTLRRAVTPGTDNEDRIPSVSQVEATFPANLDTVRDLLDAYLNDARRVANSYYVLDLSGSMAGERLDNLKTALLGLAGADTSFSGKFTQFARREKVTILTFSSTILDKQTFIIESSDPNSPELVRLRSYVNLLTTESGTAIFSALDEAARLAISDSANSPELYTSLVLMTDGENNQGIDLSEFLDNRAGMEDQALETNPEAQQVRIFPILFGEASSTDLGTVATQTNGKLFDATKTSLSSVFKEIRGYQ